MVVICVVAHAVMLLQGVGVGRSRLAPSTCTFRQWVRFDVAGPLLRVGRYGFRNCVAGAHVEKGEPVPSREPATIHNYFLFK